VCLVHLVERLRRQGFRLLDAQMINQHLAQFGIVPMSARAFHRRLDEALAADAKWG
jgi:leucyl/phenylalanyl-tRNA--protein transferase